MMKFDVWQDHDRVQEVIIRSRPICICCGGRILEDIGIVCKECIEKIRRKA